MLKSLPLILLLLLTTLSLSAAPAPAPDQPRYQYACTLFDHKGDQTLCQGSISAQAFKEWFKDSYPVAGERLETPATATPCGALALSNGTEVFIMPLYQWKTGTPTHYACQSQSIGTPPKFRTLADSLPDFTAKITAQLKSLETPDPAR
jgi:hypothetical protein